ncbi:MAG: hypothetical protein Q9164_001904 [Protoblastenia rupestris]
MDYRSTAYIHISGLPFTLSEGDILTIFSQFGEPTYLHLARDKESGKSKGFAWLKYEDQRSTDLAVDNLGGAQVMGRVLKVDHAYYKRKEGEDEEEVKRRELRVDIVEADGNGGKMSEEEEERPVLKEEMELAKLMREHDDDDPMKGYLVQEKREEVARALEKLGKGGKGERRRRHKHRHRQRESRGSSDDDGGRERRREHKHHRHRDRGGRGDEEGDRERRRERSHHRDRRSRSP